MKKSQPGLKRSDMTGSAVGRLSAIAGLAILTGACSSSPEDFMQLRELPELNHFCQAGQRVVERTGMRFELVVHEDFNAFVKSKAILNGPNGPQIQQYHWYDESGAVTGISCKLKNESHLNPVYGEGTAGPAGVCQDLNREVFRLVSTWVTEPAFTQVSFDADETHTDDGQPIERGPDWLKPFQITYVGDDGALHVASKGYIQDFGDPRFQKAPERFRGVHYCHFVAPQYLAAVLNGEQQPGATVGHELDLSKWSSGDPNAQSETSQASD